MFDPELMQWISGIESEPLAFATLSDFCSIPTHRSEDEADANLSECRWFVSASGVRLSSAADFGKASKRLTRLPSHAILVSSQFIESPKIVHWDSGPFRGTGCCDPFRWIVLETQNRGDSGWLSEELNEEYAIAQLFRSAIGSTISSISIESLASIKIRQRLVSEKEERSRTAAKKLATAAQALRSRRVHKSFFLTGSTLEERLAQFEQFIIDEGLFAQKDFFYVEPANPGNRISNLFMSSRTSAGAKSLDENGFRPISNDAVNTEWREWFWDVSIHNDYRVFNSPLAASELPSYVLGLASAPSNTSDVFDPQIRRLPNFSLFRDLLLTSDDRNVTSELEKEWSKIWCRLNTCDFDLADRSDETNFGNSFVEDLFDWSKRVYRPALVVKVRRDGEPIGAYVFFGSSDIHESNEAFSRLDDLGFQLLEILSPTNESIEAASRRESLRRLSWLMHQLNGPIGRAGKAFADLNEFLNEHADIAKMLVPNEEKAKRRAAMLPQYQLADNTFSTRLSVAIKAVADIRKVSYQIRRLKQVQGDLEKCEFDFTKLLQEIANKTRERMPEILIECSIEPLRVRGHRDIIREAIEEVLSNSCREIEVQQVVEPKIRILCRTVDATAELQIVDNALPMSVKLAVDDPFKEDASGYSSSGRGTGLGLAVVRETFRAHGGDCSLTPNHHRGQRIDGVTFIATFNK